MRAFLTIDDLEEVSLDNLDRYNSYLPVSVAGTAKKIKVSDLLGLDINEESDSLAKVTTINASSANFPNNDINLYFDQASTYKVILSDAKIRIILHNAVSGKTMNVEVVNSVDSAGVEWSDPAGGFALQWANNMIPTQTTGLVKSDIYTFVVIASTIFGAQIPNYGS